MIGATSCFRIKYGKTWLWILTFAVLTAVALAAFALVWINEGPRQDSWYQPLSRDRSPLDDGWQVVPSTDIVVVDATHSKTAIELLESRPWIPLTASQVAGLTGGSMNRNAYLLRAVYLENGPGSVGTGFNVRALGGDVHVHHQTLGQVTRMGRAAIIVRLQADPKRVFVTCSTAI